MPLCGEVGGVSCELGGASWEVRGERGGRWLSARWALGEVVVRAGRDTKVYSSQPFPCASGYTMKSIPSMMITDPATFFMLRISLSSTGRIRSGLVWVGVWFGVVWRGGVVWYDVL